MKKSIIILVLVLSGTVLYAQAPLSVYYLENIPQSSMLNAAKAPRCNGYFGVPGINSVYSSFYTNVSTPELFQKHNNQWYFLTKAEYDYADLYKRIRKAASFQNSLSITALSLGWRANSGYFSFAISDKYDASFTIPKSFFTAADKTLPPGNTYSFKGMGFNSKYYRELMLGYQYKMSSELSVGVHGKVLFGLAAFKSKVTKFDLHTDSLVWLLDVNSDIYASFPVKVTDNENAVPDSIEIPEMTTSDIIDQALLNFKNPGLAFDIGAEYIMDENWRFSGALNDLGFIFWQGDLNSFHANGNYRFEGLSLRSLDSDSVSVAVNELADSIKESVRFAHGTNGFTTTLWPKLILGAQYTPNHYFSLGFLSKSTFAKYAFQQEFNLSANINLYRNLATTLNYTVTTKGAYYVGFGFSTHLGPLQFYTLLDYIPTTYRYYQIEGQSKFMGPYDFQNFNLMLGLNLIFGANGFQNKPMVDAYSEF